MPGSPKTSVVSAPAEGERLAGLHRHAPEDLVDAELGADLADQVVRADGDSAGADEHVRLEASLERRPMEARLVGNGLESRHLGTGALERGRDHRSVRFVDLARAELDAGPPELAAGAEDRDPRPAAATNLRQTDSG